MSAQSTEALPPGAIACPLRVMESEHESALNALDRIRLRQANRLIADLDRSLSADDIMTIEAGDVLASRVFAKGEG